MEYTSYKQRWIILSGILACSFVRGFLPGMFAMANDALSAYLQVQPAYVDILTSVDNAVAVFVSIFLITVGQKFRTRLMSMATSACLGICCAAIAISITGRNMYFLMLTGRAISGISAGLLYVLPPIFANAWFPPDQIATATALPLGVMCLAGFCAPIMYSKLLPTFNHTLHSNNISTSVNETEVLDFTSVSKLFIVNMITFLVIILSSTGLFCVFSKDLPPTPPSKAQAELLKRREQASKDSREQIRFRKFAEIASKCSFWLIVVTNVTNSSALPFSVYILPSLVKSSFPSMDSLVVGYLAGISTISSAVGSIVAGKILDKFGRYRNMGILATTACAAFAALIYIGQIHRIIEILFVGYTALGFWRVFAYVCTVELLLETTYPLDRTISTSLFFIFYNLSLFVWTLLLRLTMNLWGQENVAWVIVTANIFATICLLLVTPNYKRSLANKSKNTTDRESEIEMIES